MNALSGMRMVDHVLVRHSRTVVSLPSSGWVLSLTPSRTQPSQPPPLRMSAVRDRYPLRSTLGRLPGGTGVPTVMNMAPKTCRSGYASVSVP